jgi:hypothetical protein
MHLLVALLTLLPRARIFTAAQQSSGDSQQGRALARPQRGRVTTDGLNCSRFERNADTISEKAVMRVPISLDGKLYWYQLDTGADVVIPYGSPKHEGWSPRGDAVKIPRVRLAGMFFSSILGYPMRNVPDSLRRLDLHGTVGLEPLIGHML